ncbi:secretion protein HlyD [Caldimonas brevitalea]|uniref:Secretion protein HlyD n=2 Tax=Caldimonas brevitalea TaxID=413882 RepID=A0A0G3BJZ2_9BURK|nr:secretion protein HlyD [Caldimonas brevitalea]
MSGYLEADLVYLAPSSGGTLRTMAVQRGDAVVPGQQLYALDADPERLERDAAQARRERAEAQAHDLREGRRPVELRAIDQQLAQARSALQLSTSAWRRQQQLVEQGYIAPIRLEELAAARERDAARLRELQAQRELATLGARRLEVAAASAEARAAGADAALAGWHEGEKQRMAPVSGRVFDVMYRPGEWVAPGAPVVALLPADALKLRFFVPQRALPQARVGSQVRFSCDGCAAGLTARIRWVSPQAEFTPPVIYSNQSRSKLVYLVEAQPDASAALHPGQPVDVRFGEAQR